MTETGRQEIERRVSGTRGPRSVLAAGLAVLLLVGFAELSCSDRQTEAGGGDELDELLLGRVGNYEFTAADLQKKLEYQYQGRLAERGPQAIQQHRQLVDQALVELCWVMRGEEKGYDESDVVQDTWELSRRYILARETENREILNQSEPTAEEIERYYQEHRSEYQVPTRVQVAHVQTATRAEANRVRERLQAGESIEALAREVSTDGLSKDNGGLIGWVTASSGIGHLGVIREANEAILRMHPGGVSPPVALPGDGGWSVFYALDRTEPGPRPLDDALRETIAEKVRAEKENERRQRLLADLKDEYDFEFYPEAYDRYVVTLLSDEELFTLAQREKLAENKIKQYERILEYHPESHLVPHARFMAAFTRAEGLRDYDAAREGFETFLERNPQHQLAESARWMLQNMENADQDAERLREVRRKAQSPQ
ncbi:MAG: hypothetical protein GF346_09820 [Candidatus Eisenbacteria bacterium]|nr:hypothetical protein [Candidatus Latescibacterota bacterium]MBD3302731.1 hypothetical protein [Candidatus Eisenbacteria bacterium]